jgi:hypothetical protein
VPQEEFWQLTPRLFYEMVELWRRSNEHWEAVIGRISLLFYNANKKSDARDLTLRDFTPSAKAWIEPGAPGVHRRPEYATMGDLDRFLKGIPGMRVRS